MNAGLAAPRLTQSGIPAGWLAKDIQTIRRDYISKGPGPPGYYMKEEFHMRTLKKTLCLVLALVMVLGLCAFNVSAAEFTDATQIEYKEAVGVMQAAGVLSGFEDGSFRPDETLTRAQAATMIACMMGFSGLKGKTEFTDCQGHWAEGAIAFCASEGIVSGYGDGTFGPNDTLTGSQWAVMVIGAMGYNHKAEGITGASWEIGVTKKVKSLELAKNIAGFDGTKAISREAACELGFQAMQQPTKNYTPGITVNGVEIPGEYGTDGANLLKGLGITAVVQATIDNGDLDDACGRPAVSAWQNAKGKVVYVNYQKPLATIDASSLAIPNFIARASYLKDSNGASLTQISSAINGATATDTALSALAAKTGATIEFYGATPTAKVATLAVVTSYAPYTVTRVAKNGDVTLTKIGGSALTVKAPVAGADESDDYAVIKGFALKDVLAVCLNSGADEGSKILDVAKAGTVEGKATAQATAAGVVTGVTVNGTKYTKSAEYSATDDLKLGSEGTLYLDPNGKVITFVGVSKENSNYIYVVDHYKSAEAGQYGTVETFFVLGVDANGSQVTYQVADTTKQAKFVKGEIANVAPDTAPGCSGKYINADAGKDAAAVNSKSVTLTGDGLAATAKTIAANHYFASDVKFIYVTGDVSTGTNTVRVTVKNGVQKVADGTLHYVIKDVAGENTNKLVPVVFIGAAAGYDTSNGVAFVKDALESANSEYKQDRDGNTAPAYAKTIYVDGVKTDIWYASKDAINASDVNGGFYSVATNGDLTVLNKLTNDNLKVGLTVSSVFNGYMSTIGTGAFTDMAIASDVQIISLVLNPDFTVEEFTLSELTGTASGATVSLVLDQAGKTITTIYVTAAPTNTPVVGG